MTNQGVEMRITETLKCTHTGKKSLRFQYKGIVFEILFKGRKTFGGRTCVYNKYNSPKDC